MYLQMLQMWSFKFKAGDVMPEGAARLCTPCLSFAMRSGLLVHVLSQLCHVQEEILHEGLDSKPVAPAISAVKGITMMRCTVELPCAHFEL